jgi:uncharacterized damage-inducible protein DinB
MNEMERIADQLQRAYEGDAWHGPSLRQLLSGVTADQAAARPIEGAHTIAEIVRHIAVWDEVARRRLQGEAVTNLDPSQDWPSPGAAEAAAWSGLLQKLEEANRKLREAILAAEEGRLGESSPGESQHTIYGMLHGVVQHDLYHAGQIALLKKALA